MRAAGRLIAVQAERATTANVSLPAAYRRLGRHVYGVGSFRPDFPDRFRTLEGLAAKLRSVDRDAGVSTSIGIGGKAKAIAGSAKATAARKLLERQYGRELAALGAAAYEKHGGQAGPPEIVRTISEVRGRLESLDVETATLLAAGGGRVLTPKRIAICGAAAAFLSLFVLPAVLFTGPRASADGDTTTGDVSASEHVGRPAADAEPAGTDRRSVAAVDAAWGDLVKIASLQSDSERLVVERQIRPMFQRGMNWEVIDAAATSNLSSGTRAAYRDWRSAVMRTEPRRYSVDQVARRTPKKHPYSEPSVLLAKVDFLNTASNIGPGEHHVATVVVEMVEVEGTGWNSVARVAEPNLSEDSLRALAGWRQAILNAM